MTPSPRPELGELTDLHLSILGALRTLEEATIAQIHAVTRRRSDVSAKTIATLLSRLEQRRIVGRRMEGREGVYRSLVTRREVLVARMGGLLTSMFASEEEELGAAAVRKREVRRGDAERLLDLLHRAERDITGR